MKNLLKILVALVFADLVVTMWGMYRGFREGHPLTRFIFENFGYIGLIMTFSLSAIGIWWAGKEIIKTKNKFGLYWMPKLLKLGIAIRAFVVVTWLLVLL